MIERREQVREDRDERDPHGAEEDHEHQHQGEHRVADRLDLGPEQALEHVVVEDHKARKTELIVPQSEQSDPLNA
jgi:hypothetical protein